MTITGALLAGAPVMAGAFEQARKMLERSQNDEKTVQRKLEENECNAFHDLTEASQFLSCMIAGVYNRCSQQEQGSYFQNVDQHWTHWGYKVVDFSNLAGAYDEVQDDRCRVGDLGESKDQCVRVVLFERSDNQLVQAPQSVLMRVEGTPDQLKPVKLPKYLLAIRGTIVSRYDDLRRDIQIAGEVLHVSRLHEPVKRLLLEIIHEYKPHDIWVAGHSLGAQLALIATRALAIEEDIVINLHLFNPPYLTAGVLASKAIWGALNGLGDIGNKVLHFSGRKNGWNIRVGTDKLAHKCKNRMRKLSSKCRQIAKSRYAEEMEKESQVLLQKGYVPNLYLNPKDTICNEYIKHFQQRPHVNTSGLSEVMQWAVPAKSVHMIPSAIVYINHWGEGPQEAHKLHQWFRFPHVNLTVERQGRSANQTSPGPSNFVGSY